MKNILDYPEGTKYIDLPDEIKELHESRCECVIHNLDRKSYCNMFNKPYAEFVIDFAQAYEDINGVKFPSNIDFNF